MKFARNVRVGLLSAGLCLSCSQLPGRSCAAPDEASPAGSAAPGTGAPAASTVRGAGVVGVDGIAAWNALSASEKSKLKTTTAIYLHQSVGQDLEDGAEEIGWKFSYYGPSAGGVEAGLNGGLFNDVGPIDNGKPMEKLGLVRAIAKRHAAKLNVMTFSFGYADVRDEDLARVEAEYVKTANDVRATGARMVHITPPLVFNVAENGPKMKMRAWMLSTFAKEVIFDLQDIESVDAGKRCEVGGVWRICQANRSSVSCPSKGQGVDGEGQGHLCSKKGAVFARALLYAIWRASS